LGCRQGDVNPIAGNYDAGIKFKICTKDNLVDLFTSVGLINVEFTNIERIATFKNFEDYWLPIAVRRVR
jgi:hypothetical protein